MKTEIHVTGMESKSFPNGGMRWTILDGKLKYNFSTTKKDGTETKANQGFNQMRPRVGDTIMAEVEEEAKVWHDPKTNRDVNYTDRRVMYFYTGEQVMEQVNHQVMNGGVVVSESVPRAYNQPSIPSQLDRIESALKDISMAMGIKTTMGSPLVKQSSATAPTSPAPVGTMGDGMGEEIAVINLDEVNSEISIDDIPF